MVQCFLKRSWKHIQLQNGRRRRRDLLIWPNTLLSLWVDYPATVHIVRLGLGSEVSFRPLSPSPIENLGFRPHGRRMLNVFHLWDVCSLNVSKITIALHPRGSNKWVLSKHFQIVLANLYGSQRCGPQQKLQKLWRGVFHAEELIFPKWSLKWFLQFC